MQLALLLFSLILLTITVFAVPLGISETTSWGMARWLMFLAGITLLLISTFQIIYQRNKESASFQRALARVRQVFNWILQAINRYGTVAAIILLSGFVLWFMSTGKWTIFPPVDNFYVDLGEAFYHGQVSLLQKPSPELIALADPYNAEARTGIPFIWDASYYQGNYYLYWGPVPALFYTAIQWFTGTRPLPQLVPMGMAIAFIIIFAALLRRVHQSLFPQSLKIAPAVFLFGGFLSLPFLFLIGRPEVYETSILAGQVFLFLGIFFSFRFLDTRALHWLSLAGFSWGLAVCSRINLVISVFLFVVSLLYLLWKHHPWVNQPFKAVLALFLPLIFCAAALCAYNFARFHNPFETGLSYQLTVAVEQNRYFSTDYLLSNLFIYLAYPITTIPRFPFIEFAHIQPALLPFWAAFPTGKLFDEEMFGFLIGAPILWLSAVSIPALTQSWKPKKSSSTTPGGIREFLFVIAFAGLLQFAFLMVYYYGAARFISDFFFNFLLLAAAGTCAMDQHMQASGWKAAKWLRVFFWLIVIGMMIATNLIGWFGGFDVLPRLFRTANPVVFDQLGSFFNHWYSWLLQSGEALQGIIRLLFRFLK